VDVPPEALDDVAGEGLDPLVPLLPHAATAASPRKAGTDHTRRRFTGNLPECRHCSLSAEMKSALPRRPPKASRRRKSTRLAGIRTFACHPGWCTRGWTSLRPPRRTAPSRIGRGSPARRHEAGPRRHARSPHPSRAVRARAGTSARLRRPILHARQLADELTALRAVQPCRSPGTGCPLPRRVARVPEITRVGAT